MDKYQIWEISISAESVKELLKLGITALSTNAKEFLDRGRNEVYVWNLMFNKIYLNGYTDNILNHDTVIAIALLQDIETRLIFINSLEGLV